MIGDGKPIIGITPFTAFADAAVLDNFDEDVLTTYTNEDDLAEDLAKAARALVDRVIARNIGQGKNMYDDFQVFPVDMFEDAPAALESEPVSDFRGDVGDDVNDFGTNNQETNVEEGDLVVATAGLVFAAYGDHVVCMTKAVGNCMSRLSLHPHTLSVYDRSNICRLYGILFLEKKRRRLFSP